MGAGGPGRAGSVPRLEDDRVPDLGPIMTECQCDLVSLNVDDKGIELKVTNGKKLISKSLNVPGYQVSLKQAQSSEEDALTLSMSPVSGRAK